jgi:putative transcriptional regulator
MQDIFRNLKIDSTDIVLPPVYFGGPVDVESAFILHSTDYNSDLSQQVMEQVCLSRDPHLLIDVANGKGPEHYLFTLGYAGWGPGQLEQELAGEGWLTLPATAHDLFNTSADAMWKKISAKYGINMDLYTDIPGNA